MSLKIIAFDWGNTLANDRQFIKYADSKGIPLILRKNGVKFTKKQYTTALLITKTLWNGRFWARFDNHKPGLFFQELCRDLGTQITKKQALKMNKQFANLIIEKTKLLPFAKRLIQKLYSKYLLIIISNTNHPELLKKHLKKHELTRYFSLVITSKKSKGTKSTLLPFKQALQWAKKRSITAKEIVMIGDRCTEDLACNKLGITSIILENEKNTHQIPKRGLKVKTLKEIAHMFT